MQMQRKFAMKPPIKGPSKESEWILLIRRGGKALMPIPPPRDIHKEVENVQPATGRSENMANGGGCDRPKNGHNLF